VPDPPASLTPEAPAAAGWTSGQRAVATHRGGPLLVRGAAGTGRSGALVARFAALVLERGADPEHVLLLAPAAGGAAALRERVEGALGSRPLAGLPVLGVEDLCTRLLLEEAVEAGIDPFAVVATRADRLAMLLDRVDELSLRLHDFRGAPAAMLSGLLARIDRLKTAGTTAEAFRSQADALPLGEEEAAREREFAALFEAHDRMLTERGALDAGELVLRTSRLLEERPHVRARVAASRRHVLVDALEDLTPAQAHLVALLAAEHGDLVATVDPAQALDRDADEVLAPLRARLPELEELVLDEQLRLPPDVARAAAAVLPDATVEGSRPHAGGDPSTVATGAAPAIRFLRCANARAQAQAAAATVERLVVDGADPARVGVLVPSVRHEGQAVAVALEERAVPYRLVGAAAFFQRAEVRDVVAWLRLLTDPTDAGAAVRALARPPIELRATDLARCVQIARRRKLDMVGALVAATESPQLDPAARERVLGFLKLHRQAASVLDSARPDLFVHRLIDRLGLRRRQLFAAQADVVERLVALAHLGELAAQFTRRSPQATPRDFARWLAAVAEAGAGDEDAEDVAALRGRVPVLALSAAKGLELDHVVVCGLQAGAAVTPEALHVALTRARGTTTVLHPATGDAGEPQAPLPEVEAARRAAGRPWEEREEELFGPDEALHALFGQLRDELLGSIRETGARLGELRLDTDIDVAHGVTRYLELLKLSALLARPEGQPVADALPQVNASILQAATATQKEVLRTSGLDALLLGAEADQRVRATMAGARQEPSLEAFLPRRGEGLALSAGDIETYRTCPLKYKFARVFRIPQEPTLNQRFGIVVHQVLERYHVSGGRTVGELLGLLDAGWRRSGIGGGDQERQLRGKAEEALRRYHERAEAEPGEPLWFEKAFQFQLGPHVLRGRVDRVDRLPDGSHELIDYKTGRPRSAAQLREDVQLALYAVAAQEAWGLGPTVQSYLYVLDDEKVPVASADLDRDRITETVMEVGSGILSQGFEPTPSPSACSWCDFRIACPAAER
jgi:DNA helicase II / ATP-dependent DNA helicase PcrA